MNEPVVELTDLNADAAGLDPLGLWTRVQTRAVTFDTTAPVVSDTVVWRIPLPEDDAVAAKMLAGNAARLTLTETALDTAETRLDGLMQQLQTVAASPPVSFDIGAAETLQTLQAPEANLLVVVGLVQNERGGTSFGIEQLLPWNIPEMVAEAQQTFEQLKQFLTYYARVETYIGEQFVAATTVGWSGASETVWRRGVSARDVERHTGGLAIALRTRQTMLRLSILVCQFAVKLSAMLAAPVSLPLLVPAIFSFVQDIRKTLAEEQK